ncbi:MAG: DUF1330 domain-containing protein [Alphaproteobacteria bacterium]|nr:MAG: DUF1330 domain-containing protein [Alphaproteobacteria bacterium]
MIRGAGWALESRPHRFLRPARPDNRHFRDQPCGTATLGPSGKEKRSIMTAYFIVRATIKDEAQYQKYREAVVPFIAGFGGKIAARGAKVEVLEGEHDTRSVVMFEFPTMEAIRAFWNSPDYVPIKKLREGIATINVWAFPGI